MTAVSPDKETEKSWKSVPGEPEPEPAAPMASASITDSAMDETFMLPVASTTELEIVASTI